MSERSCGDCELCCTVLRVDPLRKLGGEPCAYRRREGPGCGIYATRPPICRAYRCFWLSGGLEASDRPDRLGAVLDLVQASGRPVLVIRQAEAGAFERSPRLQEIAASARRATPVRITDAADVMDPDRPYRLLLPDGVEERVVGDRVEVRRDGEPLRTRRRPWLERVLRRLGAGLTARRLRRGGTRPTSPPPPPSRGRGR